MNRLKARIEYERILNDAIDWLRDGYRGEQIGEEAMGGAMRSEISAPLGDPRDNETSKKDLRGGDLDFQIAGFQETSGNEANFRYKGELGMLAEEIARCERCNLYLTRENTVPGVGAEKPLLMIVTAAPTFGTKETDGPLPFYESDYLDKWLRAINLRPGLDTFITPAVKCRTPGGRPPDATELDECFSYLKRQFAELEPRAVLALGAAACTALTGDISSFPSLVGKPWTWEGVPALVLWRPAEVLENPVRLRKPVWEAIQRLKDTWNALPGSGV